MKRLGLLLTALALGSTAARAQTAFGRWGEGAPVRSVSLSLHGGYHPAPDYFRSSRTEQGLLGGFGGGDGTDTELIPAATLAPIFDVSGAPQVGFRVGGRWERLGGAVTADWMRFEQTGYRADLSGLAVLLDPDLGPFIGQALQSVPVPLTATVVPVALELGYLPLLTPDWEVELGLGATYTAHDYRLEPSVAGPFGDLAIDVFPTLGENALGVRGYGRVGWRFLYGLVRYDHSEREQRLFGPTLVTLQTGGLSLLVGASWRL